MVANTPLRIATQEESTAAKGSWLYQRGATLVEGYYAKWTQENKAATQGDLLKWRSPLSQRIAECALYWMGRNPDYPAVSVRYGSTRTYTLWDDQVIEEFFKHHRNDPEDIFKPSPSVLAVANVLRDIFPEGGFTEQDILLTCDYDQTKLLHNLFKKTIDRRALKANHSRMIEISDEAIGRMALSQVPVNVNEIAEQYIINLMSLHYFNQPKAGAWLTDALHHFKAYLSKVLTRTASEDDRLLMMGSMVEFKENLSSCFPESALSLPKQQALLLVTLFLAQDMTATLLTAHFAHLSKQWQWRCSKMQQEVEDYYANKNSSPFTFPKSIEDYYEEVLRTYPPAPVVARTAAYDLMVGKTLIPQGSLVGARILSIQRRFFGENGPHACPGKDFAKVAVLTFFTRFIEIYDASFHGPKNYHLALQFTGVIKPPVLLQPKALETHGYPACKVHPD
jgi:cytochrome P450